MPQDGLGASWREPQTSLLCLSSAASVCVCLFVFTKRTNERTNDDDKLQDACRRRSVAAAMFLFVLQSRRARQDLCLPGRRQLISRFRPAERADRRNFLLGFTRSPAPPRPPNEVRERSASLSLFLLRLGALRPAPLFLARRHWRASSARSLSSLLRAPKSPERLPLEPSGERVRAVLGGGGGGGQPFAPGARP